eukprot:TRINITY_DN3304_c0_g1_i1.p1 TRINITY_DN3304_c0_g1~~TRINITY_DN3304_c0_g1_i1.p1  ORF type:complete len:373 (+),score=50.55 TRINITY_DN3304_c0_g1_i1:140-1258(+)
MLGEGEYGQAYGCERRGTGEKVAVKVARHGDTNVAYREAQCLELVKNTKRVVQILGHFVFRGHFCIVTELLGQSLRQYMKQQGGGNLQMFHAQAFTKQILEGLVELEERRIIHGDLKPENILLTSGCEVKIIDMGISCPNIRKVHRCVQTAWYRAPEVVAEAPSDSRMDIWSVGAILWELVMRFPLFPWGDDGDLMVVQGDFFNRPRFSIDMIIRHNGRAGDLWWTNVENRCIVADFLLGLLSAFPETRLTLKQALDHLFLTDESNSPVYLRLPSLQAALPVPWPMLLPREHWRIPRSLHPNPTAAYVADRRNSNPVGHNRVTYTNHVRPVQGSFVADAVPSRPSLVPLQRNFIPPAVLLGSFKQQQGMGAK